MQNGSVAFLNRYNPQARERQVRKIGSVENGAELGLENRKGKVGSVEVPVSTKIEQTIPFGCKLCLGC